MRHFSLVVPLLDEERCPEGARWSALDLLVAQGAPASVDQAFDRTEARLVRHLAAVADPVAEVEIRQAEAPALLDLPEDVIGAEARARDGGVIERVHRRQPVAQMVD